MPVRSPNGGCESWRDIVNCWTEEDPTLDLHIPSKDWFPEWTRGHNRLFASRHQQRSVIELEFIERVFFWTRQAAVTLRTPSRNLAHEARGEHESRVWKGIQA